MEQAVKVASLTMSRVESVAFAAVRQGHEVTDLTNGVYRYVDVTVECEGVTQVWSITARPGRVRVRRTLLWDHQHRSRMVSLAEVERLLGLR